MKVINALFEELETNLEHMKQEADLENKRHIAYKCAAIIEIIKKVDELSYEEIGTESSDKWGIQFKTVRKWF